MRERLPVRAVGPQPGARTPPPLTPGDEVRLEVEGIGTLTNRVGEFQPDLPASAPRRVPAHAREDVCLRDFRGLERRRRFRDSSSDEHVHDLRPRFDGHALDAAGLGRRAGAPARAGCRASQDGAWPLADLRPLPPVQPSGQVLCAGANYHKHLRQMVACASPARGRYTAGGGVARRGDRGRGAPLARGGSVHLRAGCPARYPAPAMTWFCGGPGRSTTGSSNSPSCLVAADERSPEDERA